MQNREKIRILFVDDEPNILRGLRRMLSTMHNEWDMTFAGGGAEALEILSKHPFDIVVSDMQMPGMTGSELLNKVRQLYPKTARFILSGHANHKSISDIVGPTHQYLSKPCDPETFKTVLTRASSIRAYLADENLKRIIAQIDSLPSIPSQYQEMVEELNSPDASIQRAGEIISKDPGMIIKILPLANSAFFGSRRHFASPAEAAVLLGLGTLTSLFFCACAFSQFDLEQSNGFNIESFWLHSMETADLAKRIAETVCQKKKILSEVFMAGLIHDIGRLVIAAKLPDQFREIKTLIEDKKVPIPDAEHEILHCTHAEIGAYLLGLWGMPDPIVEAVMLHHRPSDCPVCEFSPLAVVHVANVLLDDIQDGRGMKAIPTNIDSDYLTRAGLIEQLTKWQALCVKKNNGGK